MNNMKSYTGCVIGEGSLLLVFLEMLTHLKFSVNQIFTDDSAIIHWADVHGIKVQPVIMATDVSSYPASFHFLFSIYSPINLPKPIIQLAQIATVNYQNSYLPEYGGYNCPTWTILHNEKEMGYTWYLPGETINLSSIVYQEKITINANDNVASVNLKCFQAALQSFPQVIEKLISNSPDIKKPITTNKVYQMSDTILGDGLINWEWSAEEIYTLYRALSFVDYDNPIATAKCSIENEIYILDNISKQPAIKKIRSGHIVKLNKYIVVSTSRDNIVIHSLRALDGSSIKISEIISKHALSPGKNINISRDSGLTYLESIRPIRSNEHFWQKKVESMRRTGLISHFLIEGKLVPPISFQSLNVKFKSQNIESQKNILLVTLLILFYKANNYQNFSVFIQSKQNISHNVLDSTSIPLTTNFSAENNALEILKAVDSNLNAVFKQSPPKKDIFYRYKGFQHINREKFIFINISHHLNLDTVNLPPCLAYFNIAIADKVIQIASCKSAKFDFQAILDTFQCLLDSICENPLHKTYELNFVSARGMQKLLNINPPRTDYSLFKSISHIFAEIVRSYPQKIAIIDTINDRKLSYSDINYLSDSIAHSIDQIASADCENIALLFQNDADLILCMLAALKSGRSYIPLSMTYPPELLQNILMETKTKIIVTDLPRDQKILVESLRIQRVEFAKTLNHSGNVSYVTKDNLESSAYIMYTSGSSGKPKGVMIKQKGIIRLVKNTNYISIQPNDVIAQASDPSFDAATFNIWGALLNGATLVNISKNILLDSEQLKNKILTYKINIMFIMSKLVDLHFQHDNCIFRSLKYLVYGGEVLSVEIINKLNKNLKDFSTILIHAYGPTENTTFTTTYKMEKGRYFKESIPIGKSITNTGIYLMDRYKNFVAPGMVGEIYIDGDGLATGYVNQVETRKKFINIRNFGPVVQALKLGPVLYQTGDLARLESDGNIEFIGRYDNQIKLRGFRVGVGSIIQTIESFPEVSKCEILVDNEQDKILAFIVAEKEVNQNLLKKFVREKLPEYMLPAQFIQLTHLPLNKNGKVNKDRLLSIYQSNRTPTLHNSMYLNNTFKVIVNLWNEILHVDPDIYSNFFEIGGNSLSAIRMLNQLEMLQGAKISIAKFLEKPTLFHLYTLINNKDEKVDYSSATSIMDDILNLSKLISINRNCSNVSDSILLTGATGFLGRYLLEYLLKTTHSTIYCLVRKPFEIEEFVANKPNFRDDQKLFSELVCRVKFIQSNIAEDNMGLDIETYNQIAHAVSVVYHAAAEVNHIYPYFSLRGANVKGTYEILKFCNTNHHKRLNHISTISATELRSGRREENYPFSMDEIKNHMDGYSQTKWAAEYLLKKSAKMGQEVNLFRPGWILGHSQTGDVVTSNQLLCLIKSCVQLGVAPRWNYNLNFLPVDFVASSIVNIGSKKNKHHIFNLINVNSISWINLINILINYGYYINFIPIEEWKNDYVTALDDSNALAPFKQLYLDDRYDWISGNWNGVTDLNNTIDVLDDELIMPQIDRDLIYTYLSALVAMNFLPKPSSHEC